MNHPAEIKVHQYLSSVQAGEATLSDEVIDQVTKDVRDALVRQFSKRDETFRLRMSNIGRDYCRLWFDKNDPKSAIPFSTNFIINMMIGDIVEAVFKGLLVQAGVSFQNGQKVTWDLGAGVSIDGTPDLIIDGKVDDVKSASPWSYENKFKDYATLADKDSFGYVAQLAGYAQAAKVEPGGWWVVNKATGQFKYVAAEGIDVNEAAENTKAIAAKLAENKFERCYEAQEETYRKKPTGNTILGRECQWCSYRYKCWPGLKEMPSLVSQAEDKPMVSYVTIDEKYGV
jgi:hypothetical protein